ncbi:hypothetical protein F5B22DRAFT_651114 [Xylaria bambusicola]|uniref:uncharacterized protein n=1 Tax=Xylaria bambusicola TaxID=326684 RepID=UPI002007AE78|nr:uncharacterized protein F5B22DRAFT_651114 [Xylaria bambusicola]KAI0506067.1 hypothetical protein F5B22DRAFT_651114 [Xylaria bambusicola]
MESFKKRFGRPFRLGRKDEQHISENAPGGGKNTASSSVQRLFPDNNIYGLRDVHVPEDAIVDIVFLHGLNGRADKTFVHGRSGTYWPADLLPNDIPNARILSFGYDADVATFFGPVGQNTLQGHASNLVNALGNDNSGTNSIPRKIIFVAHSLGGLVVKRALALSEASADIHLRRMERDTIGVVFLGTPHRGADVASFTTAIINIVRSAGIRANSKILDVFKRESQVLASVEDSFSNWLRKTSGRFALSCFYETLELLGVGMVVKPDSATIPGWPTQSINANHMDMAKFRDSNDDGYHQVRRELQRWIQPLSANVGGEALESSTSMERERNECLRTLYFKEWNARETRIGDVDQGGDWLSSHKEYLKWIENPNSDSLWIEGKPGSGKSTLAKRIVQKWRDEYDIPGDMNADHYKTTIIAAFYYNFRGGFTEMSHELMLRSIVYQIWSKDKRLFPLLRETYRRLKSRADDHSMPHQLWKYDDLKSALQCLHQVDFPLRILLVADGMDESDNARRSDLLNFLRTLSSQTSKCVMKVLIASRPETDINLNVHKSRHIILQYENKGDILKVISRWFERLENQSKEDPIKDEPPSSEESQCPGDFRGARDYIIETADGVFLWVSLVLRNLDNLIRRGAYTPEALEKRVRKLPKELGGPDGFYHEIVQSLLRHQENESLDEDDKEDQRRQTRTILSWVTFSRIPLILRYLEDMLATPLQIENRDLLDFDLERHRPRELDRGLISYCGGLLEVRDSMGTQTVQLIHQTVREFLVHRDRFAKPYDLDEIQGDRLISLACSANIRTMFGATILRMEPDDGFSQIGLVTAYLDGNTLLIYSIAYFMTHIIALGNTGHDIYIVFESFIKEVVLHPTSYATLLLLQWLSQHWPLKQLRDINQLNAERCLGSALACAAARGQTTAVAVLLLLRGNASGQYGNPLQAAAYHGHEGIVELLLYFDVDVNAEDGQYGTALQAASRQGHENIVQILLQHGANLDLGRVT